MNEIQTAGRATEADEVLRSAELRRALRAFHAHSDAIVRRCGLTPRRHLLLLAVVGAADGSETRSIGEIATELHLAQSSATELVDRAEAAGLVTRSTPAHDGRVVRVRATTEGRRRLCQAVAEMRGERERLLAHLT